MTGTFVLGLLRVCATVHVSLKLRAASVHLLGVESHRHHQLLFELRRTQHVDQDELR